MGRISEIASIRRRSTSTVLPGNVTGFPTLASTQSAANRLRQVTTTKLGAASVKTKLVNIPTCLSGCTLGYEKKSKEGRK